MTHPTLERVALGLALLTALALIAVAAPDADAQDSAPPPSGRPLRLVPEYKPGQLIPDGFDLPPRSEQPQDAEARAFGFVEPNGGARVRPDSHSADFAHRHGTLARASSADCTSCHAEAACRDCHRTVLKPLDLHPPGYLAYHPIEARREADSCTTCHASQAFCRDCHAAAQAGGSGDAKPPSGLRFHPASWLGLRTGPDHATEARRNLMACTSCHTERDCVRCHVNVNPHPPAFLAQCRAIATRNASTCGTCHLDLARVLQMCR